MKLVLALMLSIATLVGGATAAHADHIDVEVEDDAEAEVLAVSGTGNAESETLAVSGLGTAESDTVAVSVFGSAYGATTFSFFGDSCATETSISITGTANETC